MSGNTKMLLTVLLASLVTISTTVTAATVRPNPPIKHNPGTYCSGHLKLCTAAKVVCGRC